MARRAQADLTTKTARKRLKNEVAHYVTVAPRRVLGYIRPASGAGRWSVRVETGRSETGMPIRVQRMLGLADDLRTADAFTDALKAPIEARVIDYASAVRLAAAFDPTRPDGSAPRRGWRLTVRECGEAYLEHLKARKGTRAEGDARSKLEKHVYPTLGDMAVADLTQTRLQQWQTSLIRRDDKDPDLERRSRSTANRTLHTFRAALNAAFHDEAHGIESDHAWRKLKAFRSVDGVREAHFSEAQVQTLIDAARTQDPAFGDLLEAAFWTGARYGELTALRVADFDARRRQMNFAAAITKTGKARVTLLPVDAVAFFERIAKDRPKTHPLLQRQDGAAWGKSHQARPMRAALAAAGLEPEATFYALRHTVASRMLENGAPPNVVAEQLGTSVLMLQRNYAKLLQEPKRRLVEQTAPRLSVVKGGRDAA